jgi:cytosine/adenosine deaminase-related metal-dependent hydrolase
MRLGAGMCRVDELVRAGARVGLGVDGAASNEDSNIAFEAHQALLLARARVESPQALDARTALRLATAGGAACLGRSDCGVLAPGMCADIACFRVDDLAHAGIEDLVAGVVLAPPARAETVVVNGKLVVREGRLLTADETEIARDLASVSLRLAT